MRAFVNVVLLSTLGLLAMAQDQDVDPPSRAARVSFINGNVSFQPGGVEDWIPAEPNRPLTTGDRLWSDDNSRIELNLGSSAFRLSSRTNFTFLNLDDKVAQIQLSLGTLNVRVRRLDDDETMEIDTPQAAFTLWRPGEYRIEVTEQGDATIVTVRGGDVEATANGQAFAVHAREQVGPRLRTRAGRTLRWIVEWLRPPMGSTCSARIATGRWIYRSQPAMCRAICPATRIWTPTAHGDRIPNSVPCGCRQRWSRDGLLITLDIGPGSRRGDIRGLTMRLGAMLRFTTGVGQWSRVAAGAGTRDPLP